MHTLRHSFTARTRDDAVRLGEEMLGRLAGEIVHDYHDFDPGQFGRAMRDDGCWAGEIGDRQFEAKVEEVYLTDDDPDEEPQYQFTTSVTERDPSQCARTLFELEQAVSDFGATREGESPEAAVRRMGDALLGPDGYLSDDGFTIADMAQECY